MEEPVPTYQYACTACHHQLEAVQSFTDDPLTRCPVCDGQLRKLFGSVGIVFKGPGFYRTDSRSSSNGNGSGSSGNGKSDAASKPSTNGKDSGGKDGGDKDRAAKDGGGKEKATTSTAASSASSS
jgi:putative FmdB family regulatory protein